MIQPIIGKDFPKKIIPLIDKARHSIKIVVFDWRWYPNDPGNPVQLFNQAIIRAKRRGVEVVIITNIKEVITILNNEGCVAKQPITPNLIHSKMMIIDDNILILGSHNYTQNAFTMNHEVSLMYKTDNKEELTEFLAFFTNLFNCN